MLLALAVPTAHAAGLDLLEVGGRMGTVAATNPTAVWWNPAGLAVAGGTQFAVEGAPTLGTVHANRANPDYGELVPVDGYPSTYDYGGKEKFGYAGVVPFLGGSTDFGVEGLGVGLGVYVPTAKGSKTTAANGPNRFAVREGNIAAVHASLGAAYRIREIVAVGLSGTLVNSRWSAVSDASVYPDLALQMDEGSNLQDGYLEGLDYSTTLTLGGSKPGGGHGSLAARALTFGGGVYVTPLKEDRLGISVAWNQGYRLEHTGDISAKLRCPPTYDVAGRDAAEGVYLCDRNVQGEVDVGYSLPSRLQLGVAVRPTDQLRLELMGAWVGWHVLSDYDIAIRIPATEFNGSTVAAAALSQTRQWARGAKDSFWVGVDGKQAVGDHAELGARVLFDQAAIPSAYVSANNLDADTLVTGLSGLWTPGPGRVGIGLSFSNAFFATRKVSDSVFSQDLARADEYLSNPAINRVFYPSANGTYAVSIQRLGVSVQGRFGGSPASGL